MFVEAQLRRFCLLLVFLASPAWAGPFLPAGDTALRHDVERLAAHGIIKGPVSTWPLAWGPILADLENTDAADLPPAVADALDRLKRRAAWETEAGVPSFKASLGLADNATRIRSYESTPRGRAEAGVGVSWIGEWLSAEVNVQWVDSDQDDAEVRADNSMVGAMVGNWSFSASTLDRWWGPGNDGSIILSNNARPIPSLAIDRVFTDAFETKWLSWLGPWDLNVMFGRLEEERAVPNARFFGMRFNFRPIPSLEIGLSRTAQWCGDGRPCDFDVFVDLFLGRDNIGDDSIGEENEPGNQLAGFDLRWTPGFLDNAVGFYVQGIGEDEAGGFPSRYLGQLGVDWSGYLFDRWSTQAFVEYSGTACRFHESSKLYNCGYNHGIYQTGYRYRGRSIGHGADNDAELFSVGITAIDIDDTQWRALVRFGELNADGPPDPRNTITATSQDIVSIDIVHSRAYRFGSIEIGVGYEMLDDATSSSSQDEARVYLRWRSSY